MAKVFLDANESFTLSSPADVFGSTGTEKVLINSISVGDNIASTVERVELSGALASYTFAIAGTQLTIRSGTVVVATVGVAAGQTLAFADGSAALNITGLSAGTLGGVALPTTAAAVAATLNTADKSTVAVGGTTVTPGLTGQTFLLSTSLDIRNGTVADDIFDGAQNTNNQLSTLNSFDSINGGDGRDTIVVTQNVADVDFSGTNSVERLITSGTVTLGAQASRAGIDTVVGPAAAVTFAAGYAKNFDLRTSAGTTENVGINNLAAGTNVRVTFASAEVGDGDVTNKAAAGAGLPYAGEATGGTAVRLQNEDGADGLIGGVSRVDDEGVVLFSADSTIRFDVRDLGGASRGTFTAASLGTLGADTLTAAAPVAGVTQGEYINGGAGNDVINGNTANDFLVGGAGDDTISTGGGLDSVIGGAGNDTITDNAAGRVNLDGGAGNDTFVMTGRLQAVGLVATRDTVTGGDGRDTLTANAAELNGAAVLAAGETAVITGIEVLRSADATALALTTANVQAGIEEVQFAANASSGTINFETGAKTVTVGVGAAGTLTGALIANAAGTAATDALTLNSRVTGAVDAFGNQSVTAGGYESLTISTGINATAAQSLNVVTLNASSPATNVVANIGGTNALTIASLATNSTGTFTVDASGMTAQAVGTQTLTLTAAASLGSGFASITGSAGQDTITINSRAFVNGGDGADVINATAGGNDTLNGGAGNDTITAGAGNDLVDAGAGNDRVIFGANLTNADTVVGGDGTDTLVVNAVGANPHVLAAAQINVSGFETLELQGDVAAGAQATTQDMSQFISNTTFTAINIDTDGADSVAVTGASSAIATLTVDGNTTGTYSFARLVNVTNNVLAVASSENAAALGTLTLNNEETLTFTTGTAAAPRGVNVTTLSDIELTNATVTGAGSFNIGTLTVGGTARNITFDASAATNTVSVGAGGAGNNVNFNFTGSVSSANTFTSSIGNDTLTGGNAIDNLNGGAGKDLIVGGGGADVLNGGAGADVITGGFGDDVIRVASRDETRDADFAVTDTTSGKIDRVTDFAGNGAAVGDQFSFSTGANTFGANLTFNAGAASNVTVVSIAAADSFAQLVTAFNTAVGGVGGANFVASAAATAQIADFTVISGSLAGRYVVLNNEVAGLLLDPAGNSDTIINITGVSGVLNAGDFIFAA